MFATTAEGHPDKEPQCVQKDLAQESNKSKPIFFSSIEPQHSPQISVCSIQCNIILELDVELASVTVS